MAYPQRHTTMQYIIMYATMYKYRDFFYSYELLQFVETDCERRSCWRVSCGAREVTVGREESGQRRELIVGT
jgi:hypothetical protein